MPGLVAGRFPTHARREPLGLPLELVDGDPARGRLPAPGGAPAVLRRHDPRARRADPVARRRLRRWRSPGALSPFVLEALDLPGRGASRASGRGSSPALDRLAAFEPPAPAPDAARAARSRSRSSLSFYAVDDYLTCPLKFKLRRTSCGSRSPRITRSIYGSALHKAVQEFHRRHAARRGHDASDELIAAFELAWTNEGFLTRDHEEARLAAGRDALRRFREEQLKPDAVIPAYVERDFSFTLDGDRVRGRWDRVDIEPAAEAADGERQRRAVDAARRHRSRRRSG